MMLKVALLCLSYLVGFSLQYQCGKDEDCSLNGLCSHHSTCICDPGWKGDDCGVLDLQPAKRNAGYNRTAEGISSWGSKIIQDPHDKNLYHAFLAEFTDGCGLDYWSPYSRIIRAESRTGVEGPYEFKQEVVSHFAHNPTVVWSPADKVWLMYYIGCPQAVNETCTSPHFTCGAGNYVNGESGISVKASRDLRSWGEAKQILMGRDDGTWNADVTNPSPWPLCQEEKKGWNGWGGWSWGWGWGKKNKCESDVLLAYRGCPFNCSGTEQIALALASRYDGAYERLNNDQPIFPFGTVNAEDPFIWQDKRGNFHILIHSLEPEGGFGDGPKVGRHAYSSSIEGPWTYNNRTLAFSTHVDFEDGTGIDYYRRERPQLFFSEDGKMTPLFLTTGVQEVNSSMSYSIVVPIGGE